MWIFGVLFLLDLVVACLYARESYPKVDVKAFWLKMLASAVFVLNGALAYIQSTKGIYGKLIITALVFGMVGDALLSLEPYIRKNNNKRRNQMIATVIGAAFFLFGHIFYIVAFVKEIRIIGAFRLPVFLGVWLAGVAVGVIAMFTLKLKLGKLGIAMGVYMLGLCAMGAISINLSLFGYKGNIPLQLILVVAPLLFMISDASLGLKFADEKRFSTAKSRFLTLLTYYPAQMLFGLSILMINK